jgi:hypothetical protein
MRNGAPAPSWKPTPALLSLLLVVGVATPAQVAAPPPCAGRISIALDTEDGAFDGMSHSGALLVVRNIGPNACKIMALPMLRFEDAAGRALPIVRAPVAMHPGPVVPPIAIGRGAEATTALRWVSSDAYGANNCVAPARLVLERGQARHAVEFGFKLCGPAGKPIPFEQPALKIDSVFTPVEPARTR